MNSRLAAAIVKEANRIGADPEDFATLISFETAGTFDPWKRGPRTKWGVHRGLIQMGEPQRKQFGYYKGMSIEDAVRSSADFIVANGFKPGMTGAQLYATVNAGTPYGGDRSDTKAGGTWGTANDKWNHQMHGHRKKARALLTGEYTPTPRQHFQPEPGEERPFVGMTENAALGVRYPISNEDRYEQSLAGPQPYDNFGQEIGASFQSYTIGSQAARWLSEGAVDPYWSPGDDGWAQVKEFPEKYHSFLGGAGSQSTFESRLKWAIEDIERTERLGAGGWSAMGAGLVAGVIDPVTLFPSLLTGGAAGAALGGMSLAGRLVAGSAMGALSNAAFEVGSQQIFDDPHADPLVAAGFGAVFGALGGALARNRGATYEANLALEAATSSREVGPTIANARGLPGSAGAARNPLLRDSLIGQDLAYAFEVRDADVSRGFGGILRQDIAGQMTTARNPLTRLFGQTFFEETAGFTDHSVVRDSVNTRYTADHRKKVGNFNTEYVPAKSAYIEEGGLSRMNLVERARREREYNRLVSDYIWDRNPSPDTNPHIVRGAQAVRKLMADYADDMNRTGLWTGGPDKYYLPLVANHDRIAQLDRMVHQADMERFIKSAIRHHSPDIADELASRIATGYWANLRRAGFGIEDPISKSLQINDRAAFKAAFHEALDNKNLLSDDELEQVFELLSGMMDATKKTGDGSKGIARLKQRTLLDYNFSANLALRDGVVVENFKLRDLFEDDAELVTRRYARSMSGRVAFADTKIFNPSNGELMVDGIRSEADLERLKNALRESYRHMDGNPNKLRAEMENALENIDFGWKRINGIPIYGSEKNYAQWVRRLKAFQFMRLMSNMGLNQAQESWKILSLTGFRAAISQIPSIRAMSRGVAEGRFGKDRLLNELSDMTGIGLDNLWSRYDLRLDDDRIGAMNVGGFTRGLDTFLDWGSRLTTEASLMRQTHDYQQRWAMKAITQQIAGMAKKARNADGSFDYTKIRQRDRDRLASIGLGEEDAKLLFRNLLDHSEFDWRKIVGVNVAKWDPDAVTKFRYFMGRYTDRLVQQNDFGALSKWMSRPVASMFVQFRSFVFGAWAKSTLWSLNHGALTDPRMMVLVLGEIAAGAATFMVRQAGMASTTEGREKYLEEVLDPVNLAKNGWARTATAAVLPMFLDSLLWMTPVGPQFGEARSSGTPMESFTGAPVLNWFEDAATAVRGTGNALWEGDELTQRQIRAYQRLAPLGNWVPFIAALGALIEDRPE